MKQIDNVRRVLENMIHLCEVDDDYVDIFSECLERMLNDIMQNDGFGTEAECDPRGDWRSGRWGMWKVQGVGFK